MGTLQSCPDFPELETPRLRLRKLTSEDVSDIFAYGSDSQVVRYLRFIGHRSLADSQAFLSKLLDSYKSNTDLIWGIELTNLARIVGSCRLNCDLEHFRAEIGYVVTRHYWGRGFAAEAVTAVCEFAFARMAINRIEARCVAENMSSWRVLEKCHFHFEGVLRQHELLKGQFVDVRVYSLLRGDCS